MEEGRAVVEEHGHRSLWLERPGKGTDEEVDHAAVVVDPFAVSFQHQDRPLSLLRFDGHRGCGGQAARTVSYSAGLR